MTEISLLGLIFGTLHCREVFDCNRDFDSYGGIFLYFAICLYMFKQLGSICDEYFVPSLEVIVEKLEMSNDVAGATFMAAGSSAPELFTSLVATFFIVNEGGIGTIVGSAIFNILVIVGVTSFCACKDRSLKIWWYPLTRDSAFYMISILELLFVLRDNEVTWYESVIMVLTYFLYIGYMRINDHVMRYFGLKPEEADDEAGAAKEDGLPGKDSEKAVPSSWQDPVHEVSIKTEGHPAVCVKSVEPGVAVNGELPNTVPFRNSEGSEGSSPPYSGAPKASAPGGSSEVHDLAVPGSARSSATSLNVPNIGQINRSGSTVSNSRIRMSMRGVAEDIRLSSKDSANIVLPVIPSASSTGGPPENQPDEDTEVFGSDAKGSSREAASGIFRYVRDPCSWALESFMPSPARHWSLFSLSIACIAVATYVMVDSVNRAGTILKVPPMVMGLTVLAAGTSIPDAMGSIAVAKQGEGDMAVANALGSNIFDILVGLGVPWTIRLAMGHKVLFEDKFKLIGPDIGILAGVLFLFVGALLLNKWRLTRRIGVVLIFFYFLNVAYNILAVYVFETKPMDDD